MAARWSVLFRAFWPVLMLKEIVVKILQKPPQDSELVVTTCPTHNIQQEEKSKVHVHPEDEAQEGGYDDTSKEMAVTMFQQQRPDPEMVEENGVGDHDAALGFPINERPVSGEIEAHRGSAQDIVEEDKIKLHLDTKGDAREDGHSGTLTPTGGCQVIAQHVAQHPLPSMNSTSTAKKRAIVTETCEQQKCQRCKNWTDHETGQLVKLRLESLRNEENVGRFGKNKSNEPVWEAISRHIPGKTPEHCQNRWDTVVRSFKSIKSHRDDHKKQFSQVTVRDFQQMKVAPYFRNAEWYKMFDDHMQVWDFSLRGKGRGWSDMKGSSIGAGVSALPTTGSANVDPFHPEMEQSGSAPTTCATLTLHEMELASWTRSQLIRLRRRDPQRKVTKPSAINDQSRSAGGQKVGSSVRLPIQEAFARRSGIMGNIRANSKAM